MTEATRLYLVRHGEVETSYHQKFSGRIDMNLSEEGHRQSEVLAEHLKRVTFDAIYASPMKRVQQTLAPLLAHVSSAPVIMDDLREVDFGCWTGLGWDEVMEQYNCRAFDWLHHLEEASIRDAECGKTFRARVEPCLNQILTKHPGQTVAVYCHGGVIRMILSILLGLPLKKMALFEVDYASLSRVDYHPQKTELQLLNFIPWQELP